jgi:hypothetical protein
MITVSLKRVCNAICLISSLNFIFLSGLIFFSALASAEAGVELYKEQTDSYYFNSWIGYKLAPVDSGNDTGQVEAAILGEGKDISFRGIVSINCENGKHFWEGGFNANEFLKSDSDVDAVVPLKVVRGAKKKFCHKK